MISLRTRGFHAFDLSLLSASSLLVPLPQRSEWLCEWKSEYWHVRRACLPCCGFSWNAQREVTAFCLGAPADAVCLRRDSSLSAGAVPTLHGSAAQCLLWMATLLALCAVLARLLPGVKTELDAASYQIRPGLVFIQNAGSANSDVPTISTAQFRDWRSTRQHAFDSFAYYRTVHNTAFLRGAHPTPWTVALATPNLFSLLGVPAQHTAPTALNLPELLLSHRVWLRQFHADPHIAGRAVLLNHVTARVAGVIPEGPWRLPGDPDAFLLEPSAGQLNDDDAPGYLIAHLSPMGRTEMLGATVSITAHGPKNTAIDLAGIRFSPPSEDPRGTFEFAIFLALLALPAVTSVTLTESNFSGHRPNLTRRLARWFFLAAKVTVIAAIAYFASLDLAYAGIDPWSPWASFVQLVSSFVLCLFGLRWAVADQRQRCPVCLRRVTHPARVGIASRTFLGWNGTEMVCLGGHTLLHVPSLPTSWFGAPRWLYLDHSWDFLFVNNTAA